MLSGAGRFKRRKPSDEFRKDTVRTALTSGFTRNKVAFDLGMGMSTAEQPPQAARSTAMAGAKCVNLYGHGYLQRALSTLIKGQAIGVFQSGLRLYEHAATYREQSSSFGESPLLPFLQ